MIKDQIKVIFEDFFKENHIRYFIGGSERFGYKSIFSDIDFFALMHDPLNYPLNHYNLFSLPHTETHNDMYTYNNTQFSFLGGLIHLTIFDPGVYHKQEDFSALEEEHYNIEKLLADNPKIRLLISHLKRMNIKGAEIYRAMKRLL